MRTMYILRTDDRPTDRPTSHFGKFHPIHFMFGSKLGFSRSADRMDLHAVVPDPRFGRPPSWKISNDYNISGMSYPIHFHELQSSFGGIQEKVMREE